MEESTCCLIVEFELAGDHRAAFLRLVRENAAQSVNDEPGCLRFDVLVPEDGGRILLYEIYASRASFDLHLASQHFRRFDRETKPMLLSKVVTFYSVIENAKFPDR